MADVCDISWKDDGIEKDVGGGERERERERERRTDDDAF